MHAARYREIVTLQSPQLVPDDRGGHERMFVDEFPERAEFIFMRGSETAQAARLEGRQPLVVRMRRSENTERIETNWRLVDVATGRMYNVRSTFPSENHREIEMMCEGGVDSWL